MKPEATMGQSQLESEIHEQPRALAHLLETGRPAVEQAAARIRDFNPAWVSIAARGTSDNAARYAQYLLGAHNQLSVGLAVPSLYTLYDTPPTVGKALTIGISQSGRSPDIVSVIEHARQQGGLTLCITNDPHSPLAQAAELCIPLSAGAETSIAATKTYSNSLLAVAMLSAALERSDSRWATLETIPDAVAAALTANPDLGTQAKQFADARQLLVLGRGFNYCTAFEVALKIKETSYTIAEPYSGADLLHGPVAMIDNNMPIILVATTGKGSEGVNDLLDLIESRSAPVIAISDRVDILERAQVAVRLPQGIPEWVSPIVAIAPGQQWARFFALAKGLDPDQPRGLSKVTLTR